MSRLSLSIRSSLREFDLEIALSAPAGSTYAIVGPSGAGKSTVLRAIAGLHRPREGRVALGEAAWFDAEAGIDLPAERRSCGYVFQEYALFPHLSVWRNVAFGLGRGSRAERRPAAVALLERFGVGRLADESPAAISGGERQRVALARALAREPAVLLLDEPLAALDATTAAASARELRDVLGEAGVPAILVTHDFAEAALLADRVAVIDRGQVVQEASSAELSARPASAFVADFAGASVLRGIARRGADGLTEVEIEGGGRLTSTDSAEGSVGVAVYPWEVGVEVPAAGSPPASSVRNRLAARVISITEIGNRVRLGLASPQPFAAELTSASLARLDLHLGDEVVATFKATATRLVER